MEIDIQRLIRQLEQTNADSVVHKIEYKHKGKDYVLGITIKHKEENEDE